MPFLVNNECLETPAQALQAFQSLYPLQQAGTVYYLGASSISSSGLLNFQLLNQKGSTVIASGNLQLLSCSMPSQSVFVSNATALFTLLLIVFFTAFFLRKAIRFFTRFLGGFSSDL